MSRSFSTPADASLSPAKRSAGQAMVLAAAVGLALLLAGCGNTSSDPAVGAVIAAQDSVRDEWESQTNTLVKSVVCNETVDLDHFTCTVKHENADGNVEFARLNVACDDDRCVWRER